MGKEYADIAEIYGRYAARRYLPPARDLVKMLQLPEGSGALDIGCGTGIALPVLKDAVGHEGNVVGVDPSLEMISFAPRERDIHVVLGALPRLPFMHSSFEATIMSFVLSHIEDSAPALIDACRVLRRGGNLGVSCWGPAVSPHRDLWFELTDSFWSGRNLDGSQESPLPAEVLFENRDATIEVLVNSGLHVTAAETMCYTVNFSADEYVEMRSILSPAQALHAAADSRQWSDFVEHARLAYHEQFGPAFSVTFDAHLVVGRV
jgi:SAM-dependent methyltransferase